MAQHHAVAQLGHGAGHCVCFRFAECLPEPVRAHEQAARVQGGVVRRARTVPAGPRAEAGHGLPEVTVEGVGPAHGLGELDRVPAQVHAQFLGDRLPLRP
ncbi:hypothetical protein ACWDYF_35805 [Streptomyces sp. NPDC003284]